MTATKKPAAKKTSSAKSATPDAIALLTADHKEVHTLFVKYRKLVKDEADAPPRQALAQQICALLTVHATIEEEIFYPAAREADVDHALLDEAEVEHASAKALMGQIASMDADEALYDANVIVLAEYIEHHVKEEEGEMFPEAKKAGVDMEALGQRMQERKSELLSQAENVN
jgi:hemerythrin superfamily protein